MELLAPAGNWEAFLAAVLNGADAVYIGGHYFNARRGAENFSIDQIKKAVEFAHLRGVKVYVTVNTLLHSNEFNSALDYIYTLYNTDIDAVILQDLGLFGMLAELLPDLPLHASTQMTVHNTEGVQLLQQQGIKRVVLARELSLPDLRQIRENVSAELEVFVHGALCYSYSGQCLFSSMAGGRSGNRGRCAQPCRLPYILQAEKSGQQETPGKYLLSPADLALIDYLPDLYDSGITSLKIEGRMKRPEYVTIVTRSYRQLLDYMADHTNKPDPGILKQQMLGIFNRSFTPGYLDPGVVRRLSMQRPDNRGIYIGEVISQNADGWTTIRLTEELSVGDGIEIRMPRGKSAAFTVEQIKAAERLVNSAASGQEISLRVAARAAARDRVYKTHDVTLIKSAQASYEHIDYQIVPVDIEVILHQGQPLQVIYKTDSGQEAKAHTSSLAAWAEQQPLDEEVLKQKLGRLGDTPFKMNRFSLTTDGSLIIPFKEINQARRQAVDQLKQLITVRNQRRQDIGAFKYDKEKYLANPTRPARIKQFPELRVLVNSIETASQAILAGADRVYLAAEGLGTQRRPDPDEISRLKQAAREKSCEFMLALPRIQKPTDSFDYHQLIQKVNFTEVLVGDLGSIYWCRQKGVSFWTDYSLNVINPYSLNLLKQWGAKGICASPELSMEQLKLFPDLGDMELLVYGELILMVSQTCVLYEVLEGKQKCSHWCQRDQYNLCDSKGYTFPVQGDADCRFYIFNSRTLAITNDLPRIISLSPGGVRLEMRRSSAEQVKQVVSVYRSALNDIAAGEKINADQMKAQLEPYSFSPFTKGHYYRGVE